MPSPRKVSPSPSLSASTSCLKDRSIRAVPIKCVERSIAQSHVGRQPKRKYRKRNENDESDQVGDDERQHAIENGRDLHVLDHALDDEDVHADRRMDEAELDRHDDDDAEPDRIETE